MFQRNTSKYAIFFIFLNTKKPLGFFVLSLNERIWQIMKRFARLLHEVLFIMEGCTYFNNKKNCFVDRSN